MESLGFHEAKSQCIHHADTHKLPCVQTLYKRTFDVTNQLPTHSLSMFCMVNGSCMVS